MMFPKIIESEKCHYSSKNGELSNKNFIKEQLQTITFLSSHLLLRLVYSKPPINHLRNTDLSFMGLVLEKTLVTSRVLLVL